jgi:AmmeMemoRadiSam system protein A
VVRNARLAAFEDPRLPAVTWSDVPAMTVKISVLSALEPRPASSLDAVLAWLQPGVDGLVLAEGRRRATFLPSVWESLADPVEFVELLLDKAMLPRKSWPAGLEAWRYTTEEIKR